MIAMDLVANISLALGSIPEFVAFTCQSKSEVPLLSQILIHHECERRLLLLDLAAAVHENHKQFGAEWKLWIVSGSLGGLPQML